MDRSIAQRAPEAALARAAERARKRRSPPVALGALAGHLGYFVRRLQLWVFQDFVRRLAEVDIRPAQYSVLAVIHANPGLPQAALADFLAIERARLVRLLDRLEKRDLLRRRASRRDRRSHALFLTQKGERQLRRINVLADEHEAHLAEWIGSERHRLLLELLRECDWGSAANGGRGARE
jgi:DNA-binding MarR family transcriptional regulator